MDLSTLSLAAVRGRGVCCLPQARGLCAPPLPPPLLRWSAGRCASRVRGPHTGGRAPGAQEPLLLSGSVRDNLLMAGLASGCADSALTDSELWAALSAVRMQSAVSRLPLGLDAPMADAGARGSELPPG